MAALTAIDVLIDPDEQAIERGRVINARLLEDLPQGWALDDTHKPHITTPQRYVRTSGSDQLARDGCEVAVALSASQDRVRAEACSMRRADWLKSYGLIAEVGGAGMRCTTECLVAAIVAAPE